MNVPVEYPTYISDNITKKKLIKVILLISHIR